MEPLLVTDVPHGSGALCAELLASLPSWFGDERSNRDYVEVAEQSPAVVASMQGRGVGLLLPVRHGRYAAEIHLMAVRPERQRLGVGRRLIEHLAQNRAVYAPCGVRTIPRYS